MSLRGFLTGSLALIALYVLAESTAGVGKGLGVAQSAFERALSPNVAGIPRRATTTATTSKPSTGGSVGEVKAPPVTQNSTVGRYVLA
jgi:hypothetical protein